MRLKDLFTLDVVKLDLEAQSKDDLLKAYRTMRTIREFEERVHIEFATGAIPGSRSYAHRSARARRRRPGPWVRVRKIASAPRETRSSDSTS